MAKKQIPDAGQLAEASRESERRHANRDRKRAQAEYLVALATARALLSRILAPVPGASEGTAADRDVRCRAAHKALDDAGRAALMADAAVELKLVSATYTPDDGDGNALLTLEFNRAIDPSGFIDEAYGVTDAQFNHQWYWVTGTPTMSNFNKTVQFLLTPMEPTSGSGVHLTASSEANGIVAVDDGEPWLGVSDLALPFSEPDRPSPSGANPIDFPPSHRYLHSWLKRTHFAAFRSPFFASCSRES